MAACLLFGGRAMQHKSLLLMVTVAGLFGAAPAQAQVTGVITKSNATTTLFLKSGASINDFTLNFSGTDIGISSGYTAVGSGSTFDATSSLGTDFVSFRNGNVNGGLYALTTSHTIVDITFTNDGTGTVRPELISTILPAGLGLFIDSKSCMDRLTGCGPADPITNPATFQSFSASGLGTLGTALAGASFDFKVTGGGETLYDLAGGITLMRDASTLKNVLVTDLDAAAAALKGFQITSPTGSDQQYGVAWDATDFSVDFGLGSLLAPGESSTLRYETTVTSFTQVDCVTVPSDACLLAYSAFGDPIGRGGGTSPSFTAFLARLADTPSLVREFTPAEDDLLKFGELKFQRPVYKDGKIYFELLKDAVPEPATWAMMIAGFALAGGALRRRPAIRHVRVG